MAVQAEVTVKGVPLTAAYVRVYNVFGGKRENWGSVVHIYASAEAANDGTPPLDTYNQSALYDPDEPNPYALIYAAVMADPRYTNAVEV